jgi:hypothetical protein
MAQAVIPYLHSESKLWIFGQIIGYSDSGCFKFPVFRYLNMMMVQPDGNLLAQAYAGRCLTAWCKKCVDITVWPLRRRAYICSSSSLFPKAWISLLTSVHHFIQLSALLICFDTHCMIHYIYNYRKLLFSDFRHCHNIVLLFCIFSVDNRKQEWCAHYV